MTKPCGTPPTSWRRPVGATGRWPRPAAGWLLAEEALTSVDINPQARADMFALAQFIVDRDS